METKKNCSKCGEETLIEDLGNRVWCKRCCADYQREYRANHLEKMQEYQRNYHRTYDAEQIESLQTYRKAYWIKKKTRIDEALKFYNEHKGEIK